MYLLLFMGSTGIFLLINLHINEKGHINCLNMYLIFKHVQNSHYQLQLLIFIV